MSRFFQRPVAWIPALGLLFGLGLLLLLGTPPSPGASGRIVLTDRDLDALRERLSARHGQEPAPAELRGVVEASIRAELLRRAAVARGYPVDAVDAGQELPRRMERIARTRWTGTPPTPADVGAYFELRRERYADLVPAQTPGPPDDGAWLDPGWSAVRDRVAADIEAEGREAAVEQLVQEVAAGVRFVLGPSVRTLLEGSQTDPPAPAHPQDFVDRTGIMLLEEIEAGHFDLSLHLPPGDQAGPSARPSLPDACTEVEAATSAVPVSDPSAERGAWTMERRRVACVPPDLGGLRLGVDGLTAAGDRIHLEIETAEGRRGAWLLTPEAPRVTLPSARTGTALASSAIGRGALHTLATPELGLLALAIGLLGFGAGTAALGILGFTAAHLGAQSVVAAESPLLSTHLTAALALLALLPIAAGLTGGHPGFGSRIGPLWVVGLLFGALFGASGSTPPPDPWLSTGEGRGWLVLTSLGAGLALAVPAVLATAARAGAGARGLGLIGGGLGVVAIGLLVRRLPALLGLLPTGLPRVPFELALLALALGFALPSFGLRLGSASILGFALLLAAGSGLGPAGWYPDPATTLAVGSLFLVGVLLAAGRDVAPRTAISVGVVAALGAGWYLGGSVAPDGAVPLSLAIGSALVVLFLFHVAGRVASATPAARRTRIGRGIGIVALGAAVLWRLGDYRVWIAEDLRTRLAFGLVPVPLAALLLSAVALIAWPRRRKVAEALGKGLRRGILHWAALALAFFLLPFGTISVANPAHRAEAPAEEDARRIVADLLWNTYEAFNLNDEDEVYDRLSRSVTETLLPTLYLDSRRRLSAGIAEEDEVVVRNVELVPHRGTVEGVETGAGFTYSGQWVVTARIRHLQHAHDRRNVYTGSLEVRMDEDGWRIDRVELTSEERVVAPWTPS